MSLNLIDVDCLTESDQTEFGICDDPPPAENPAFLDNSNRDKWIGIVQNPQNRSCCFYAVDRCVEIKKEDGSMDKRCDGILQIDDVLLFVELKERASRGWIADGIAQLERTIENYKLNHENQDSIRGQICNRLRPRANSNHAIHKQRFKDMTGYSLEIAQKIIID